MDTDLRPDTSIDPLVQQQMQERLARLAERRTGGAAGSSHSNGSQRTTSPKPSTSRRRHAAQGSRTAAVMMSVGVAAGLTGYFQRADAAAAAEAAAASSATASVATASSADTAGTATQVLETSTASAGSSSSTDTAAQSATDTAAADTAAADAAAADAAATAAATVSATGLADGTYTGATDTNKWGPVQVQITVSGGVITEVVALQTPDDDGKSVRINDQAVPVLVSETLAAQSADIDSVSGATYTSDSYKVSLQSAIDLAKATAQQAAA